MNDAEYIKALEVSCQAFHTQRAEAVAALDSTRAELAELRLHVGEHHCDNVEIIATLRSELAELAAHPDSIIGTLQRERDTLRERLRECEAAMKEAIDYCTARVEWWNIGGKGSRQQGECAHILWWLTERPDRAKRELARLKGAKENEG